jgi:hypothetical protein
VRNRAVGRRRAVREYRKDKMANVVPGGSVGTFRADGAMSASMLVNAAAAGPCPAVSIPPGQLARRISPAVRRGVGGGFPARAHQDGRGDLLAQLLAVPRQPYAESRSRLRPAHVSARRARAVRTATHGKNQMPPWDDLLDSADIESLWAYVGPARANSRLIGRGPNSFARDPRRWIDMEVRRIYFITTSKLSLRDIAVRAELAREPARGVQPVGQSQERREDVLKDASPGS